MVFSTYNINFKKGTEDWIIVAGEIRNDSARDYRLAMFRIFVYDKKQVLGNGVIKIYDFRPHSTRSFETLIENVSYQLIPAIARHEIVLEEANF